MIENISSELSSNDNYECFLTCSDCITSNQKYFLFFFFKMILTYFLFKKKKVLI